MKRLLMGVALACVLAFGVRCAAAADAPVTLNDAAKAAIDTAYPGATVKQVRTEGKGESKFFVVTLAEKEIEKLQTYVDVSEAGAILQVTKGLAELSKLPKAVTDAVEAASAGAKITSAAKVEQRAELKAPFTKLEKVQISYNIRFTTTDLKHGTMDVAEDGTVLRAPKFPKPATPTHDTTTPAPATTTTTAPPA